MAKVEVQHDLDTNNQLAQINKLTAGRRALIIVLRVFVNDCRACGFVLAPHRGGVGSSNDSVWVSDPQRGQYGQQTRCICSTRSFGKTADLIPHYLSYISDRVESI